MKKNISALGIIRLFILVGGFSLPSSGASTGDLQGQALVDGMVTYKSGGTADMVLEGSAAKAFFERISQNHVTSAQATDNCQKLTVKTGTSMECSYCENKNSDVSELGSYWCTLEVDTDQGQVLNTKK